jgi:putative PEP-CTERM system histidine kinase
MDALIIFWSHALAAMLFLALAIWRLKDVARQPAQRLLAAAFALTACWAWLSAVMPGDPLNGFAESARNLVWIGLLYSLSAAGEERQHGVRLVYGAVAAVIGMQLIAQLLGLFQPSDVVARTNLILDITAAAGALVLVHNLYGQAAPSSRSHIRLAMLGLAWLWGYDLNLYTLAYLGAPSAAGLAEWRGVAVALTAPLFALGARDESGWRIRLSRAATFQSLSLLAICAYFALMAIVATALRGSGFDWSGALMIGVLAVMTVGAMAVIPSARARGWLKVKLAKHLFEHRYDYRTEWLRFTGTLGRAGPDAAPLSERIVQAFADVVDAPGGMLLVSEGERGLTVAATWNWPSAAPPADQLENCAAFWAGIEASGRILEFEGLRSGWAKADDKALPTPPWMIADKTVWAGVPLIHNERMVGLVILAAPEFRRALDWEDFDLLRTAGNQAASSLAEAFGQEALVNAQRFEEFNRRFAFILHDIKNLVSQLSLLARNAERHADNPEFRDDMVGTLQSSVGKMRDLLARLSPRSPAAVQNVEPQPLLPILSGAIAAKRREREVTLLGDAGQWAAVDAGALEQALGHLLQNALEASTEDEPVTVRVNGAGPSVAIAITDHGCGMDGDFVRNSLFQPFASTKAGGFGIGAFEARSLVAAMGGRISVDSRPGTGTTFTILLPAAEPDGQDIRKSA